MSVSDEALMAYADGEGDAATCRLVEAAMRSDPQIAKRVTQHRELRARLSNAYAAELSEPIPETLLRAVRATGNVVDLQAAREARLDRGTRAGRRPPLWSAVAASLVLGVAIGVITGRHSSPFQFADTPAGLVADGALAEVLTNQLASNQSSTAKTRVGLTFMAKSGLYCRTFTLLEAGAGGLACRTGNVWQLQALSRSPDEGPAHDGFRMAATALPPAILSAVSEQISGQPLDAGAESAARKLHWQGRSNEVR